jgi:hypothetical protein
MTYIDSTLLDATEWFCRKFQVLTGRTNLWLAFQLTNLSVVVYFVWAGLYFVSSDLVIRLFLAAFCGGLLYLLTQTLFKDSIETHEANAYRRVARGLRNPRRLRDAMLRFSFLTLCVMLWYPVYLVYFSLHLHIVILTYSLVVLTTLVLYLLACDPLPPCEAKVTQWVRGALRVRATREPARRAIRRAKALRH